MEKKFYSVITKEDGNTFTERPFKFVRKQHNLNNIIIYISVINNNKNISSNKVVTTTGRPSKRQSRVTCPCGASCQDVSEMAMILYVC